MTPGKVTGELAWKLRRAVEERGVVVWYDPEGAYTKILPSPLPEGTAFLTADDGFFRLRRELEPFLEFVDDQGGMKDDANIPPRLIVYVRRERSSCRNALVEAETAGCVLEPGAPSPERDTRLSSLVRSVFSATSPLRADDLAARADQGTLSVEDFDRMSEEATGVIPETLRLIFDNTSQTEVLLRFVASDAFDASIVEKKALGDIARVAASETGFEWNEKDDSPAAHRSAFSKHLLLSEFLSFMGGDERPSELARIRLPNERIRVENVRGVCSSWRNRGDLKETYTTAATRIEASLSLESMSVPLPSLEECETFPFLETKLLDRCLNLIRDGDAESARSLSQRRCPLFWSAEDPEFSLPWSVAEAAATLRIRAEGVLAEVKKGIPPMRNFVDSYISGKEPWMLLDRSARQLESRCARLEFESDLLLKVIHSARSDYARTVHVLASAYADAFTASGGKTPPGMTPHCSIFRDTVTPLLERPDINGKIAFFMVDALRYEMAAELADGFGEECEVSLRPVWGALPGITQVGMAALLPGAEKGLSLERKQNDLSVILDGKALSTRNARIEHLRSITGPQTVVMKLGEAARLSPKRKKEVEAARLLVVTSQEIDRLGEGAADEEETRAYMDDVLGKIHRAIRSLARCGVTRFLVAADHGFQLVSTEEAALSMDPPGGDTVCLDPRVWIGKGGSGGEGFFRRSAREIGVGGDLEFAFPRGLAVFTTRGGAGLYFHGGISPQEHILPLLSVVMSGKCANESTSGMNVSLRMAKQRITNRIFMVTLASEPTGLYPAKEQRVRLEITSGKTETGITVAAAYGFDEASRELTVECDRLNSVTLMLSSDTMPERVTITAIDPQSQVALDTLRDVPVDLM